jgi:hypothetical protein
MSEPVVIKHVEEEKITLSELKKDIWTWRHTVILIASYLIAGAVILAAALKLPIPSISVFVGVTFFWTLCGGFLIFVGSHTILSILQIFLLKTEGYDIGISKHRDHIFIPKLNSEADQIAICKAAKELEKKAWEYANRKRELQRIAENCK